MTSSPTRAERIAAARLALAERYAADPDGVERFNARMAKISQAKRREQHRVERVVSGHAVPMPAAPDLTRPAGVSSRVWKAERKRRQDAYRREVSDWNRRNAAHVAGTAPTPEQMGKATYVEEDTYDRHGPRQVRIGRAFTRQPRFETMDFLTGDQVAALRRYRRAFDVSEMSATKCALDVGTGGGRGGSDAAVQRLELLAFASLAVDRIEAGVPAVLLPVLRSVALYDQDFKAVAAERYGSVSGARRARVRAAVIEAAAILARNAAPPPIAPAVQDASTPAVEAVSVNPDFLDERGMLRPFHEIAAIITGRNIDEAA